MTDLISVHGLTKSFGDVEVLRGIDFAVGIQRADRHAVAAQAQRTGVGELHASAKAPRASAMRYRNPALAGLSPDWTQSDESRVRALVRALRA